MDGREPSTNVFLGCWRNVAHPQEVLVEQEEKHRRLQGERGEGGGGAMPKPSSVISPSWACQGQRVSLSMLPHSPLSCDQMSG